MNTYLIRTTQRRSSRLLACLLAVMVLCSSMFVQHAFAASGVAFEDVLSLTAYAISSGDCGVKLGSVNANTGVYSVDTSTGWKDFVVDKTFNSNRNYKNNNPSEQTTTTPDWTVANLDLNATNIIPWNILVSLANAQNNVASDYPNLKRCCATANQIVSTFKTEAEYNKALTDVKNISWTYDSSNNTLKADAPGDQHKLDNAVSSFKAAAAGAAANNAFGSIYDSQQWNPSEGVAGDFLQGVYGVVNTIFFVVSNLMLWFFLLQTGFDALYIIAEPVRPFIGPKTGNGGGMGINNGGQGNFFLKIHIPICSHAVEQACNGGGGLGGNNGGGASAGNAFFSYALKRFPVLLCCAVYLILVTLGYWPRLISWVSQFAVQIIDFIMRLGQ